MTYFFETYGCQMNIAESAAVEQLLISRGWTKAEDVQVSDLVIINTCSVRQTAENRIFGRLGWFTGLKALREKKPDAKSKTLDLAAEYVKEEAKPLTLVVMGCMAERLLKSLKKDYPVVDYVVGTYAKKQFGDIISAIENKINPSNLKLVNNPEEYEFSSVSLEPGAFSAFVPVMHGCNNFCTYCIVPYVRGREKSRSVEDILKEIDFLSKNGVKEITLLGQNVNSYSYDGVDFPELLERICDHIEKTGSCIGWVRFMSSHPKDLSEKLIDVISKRKQLCHHIHLPVQHGSTKVLHEMNRRYTREDYIKLVEKIRSKISDVSLTTDIMVGFPGETEEDFEEVISLMKTILYENAFMYYYNPREGTPASVRNDQVELGLKKERLQRVIDLQLEITKTEMLKRVGDTVDVLVENVSRDNESELLGKTQQDERVAFAAEKSSIGKFVKVKLLSLSGNTFRGTLV
ncbi:MAG: tRNA (N6-isopentenyl adenosine(37)-C2)-methylthiotransferase MiaB [Treponema sp.]|nr:tRNA (N6-isopentenyl adenosine(37)-C2)-methylthiotransferase MiaB [Treponema sp.]